MSIESVIHGFASLGAQWVLFLLLGLSVLALAVIVERAIYFATSADDVASLRADLRNLFARDQIATARELLAGSRSCEAKIVGAAIDARSPSEADERMAGETELQRLAMEQRLAFLGTLGNNAPFVGLLGTVIGIVGAFHQLDASAGKLSAGLMSQIGEALVATAVGLVVALPAVAAFNIFQRVIRVRLARASALGRELVAMLHAREAR